MATIYPQYETPLWYRERAERRRYRAAAKRWGLTVPRLRTVCLVETEMIQIPAWALAKAVQGLKAPAGAVWLGRIHASALAKLDRAEGGHPKLTETCYRRCGLCGRGLIGAEAEIRWEEDRKWAGRKLGGARDSRNAGHRGSYDVNDRNPDPCGPDCVERSRAGRPMTVDAAIERFQRLGKERHAGT